MVYDMQQGKFPVEDKNFSISEKQARQLSLKDLKMYVELQQIGYETDLEYYSHADPQIYNLYRPQVRIFLLSYFTQYLRIKKD